MTSHELEPCLNCPQNPSLFASLSSYSDVHQFHCITDDSVSNTLPDNSDQSWPSVHAILWRAEKHIKSKDEVGEKVAGEDKYY